ncbi:MAG: alpha,alpha-trehalase [bacterium]|nr:alpha,alpha-trehalase [bacterium]
MVEFRLNPFYFYKKVGRRKKVDLNKKNYIQLSGELFKRVQINKIFPDSKTFTDSTPLFDAKTIERKYALEKKHKNFNLKNFVIANFQIPIAATELIENAVPANRSVETYINSLWSVLYRNPDGVMQKGSTLIPLPYPYIVPGGRFREIYYWDTYFTALGLVSSKMIDMVRNTCDNFCYLIDQIGYIPNANRIYEATRSQPPFFVQLVKLLIEHTDTSCLHTYLPYVQKEYEFWMKERSVQLDQGFILNRYGDKEATPREEAYLEERLHAHKVNINKKPQYYLHNRAAAESGWDFSGRWFADHNSPSKCIAANIIPVELNCMLYLYEKQLHAWYKLIGEDKKAGLYLKKGTERVMIIQKYLYNKNEKFFFDYNFETKKQINYPTLAGVFPLYAGIATKEQAQHIADKLKKDFLYPGGLVTSLHESGEQWDFPNGWAPLEWIAIQGLKKYGFTEFAGEIKARWLRTCENTFKHTGNMYEKYNVVKVNRQPEDGEYPLQTGFGWTNGVYVALLHDK